MTKATLFHRVSQFSLEKDSFELSHSLKFSTFIGVNPSIEDVFRTWFVTFLQGQDFLSLENSFQDKKFHLIPVDMEVPKEIAHLKDNFNFPGNTLGCFSKDGVDVDSFLVSVEEKKYSKKCKDVILELYVDPSLCFFSRKRQKPDLFCF